MSSDAGKKYGHYEVESVLGRGAMGTVYLARDTRIGRRVALKTVKVEAQFEDDSQADEFYERLQREAELGGSLQHPNIVTLYEPGYEGGRISWLATEYVEGESLRERIKREARVPLADALSIIEDVLKGLAFAHRRGVIHRDIKPANILVSKTGEAKIADFGIARAVDSTLTSVGSILGTPSYMSPEQVRCTPVTPRTDLFSAGVLFYELLTGQKPFSAPDIGAILKKVVEFTPPPPSSINSEVAPAFDSVVAKLMAKHPGDRYDSADAALEALADARNGRVATPTKADEIETIATDPNPALVPVKVAMRQPNLLTRQVPVWAVAIVMILFAAVLTAGYLAVKHSLESEPISLASIELESTLAGKRQLLMRARELSEAGRYSEAVHLYEQYIRRYPQSVVARGEQQAAREKLAEVAAVDEQKTDTVAEKPEPRKKKAPPKKPGFRERLKRIFTRG